MRRRAGGRASRRKDVEKMASRCPACQKEVRQRGSSRRRRWMKARRCWPLDGHVRDDNGLYILATRRERLRAKTLESHPQRGFRRIRPGVCTCGEHPRNTNLLFAGDEFGLWYSWIAAEIGRAEKQFPHGAGGRHRIQARGERTWCWPTHGRSISDIDDLTPMKRWTPSRSGITLTISSRATATTWHLRKPPCGGGQKSVHGDESQYGAI